MKRIVYGYVCVVSCMIMFAIMNMGGIHFGEIRVTPSHASTQFAFPKMDDVPEKDQSSFIYNVVMNTALATGSLLSHEFSDVDTMKAFYSARDNFPIWAKDDPSQEVARGALAVLENSWTHGLNPNHYNVSKIRNLIDRPFKIQKAQLELLLTDSVMRYGSDMTRMRADAKKIRQEVEYWREPVPTDVLLRNLSVEERPHEALRGLEPKNELYAALRTELIRLSGMTTSFDHLLPIDFKSPYFFPGKDHKDVAKLRQRMGLKHDPSKGSKYIYDDALVASVKRFQKDHGVEPDGIIGPQTLSLLNHTVESKMQQVIANMERIRWEKQDMPDRYIEVNIPSQTLVAVDHGQIEHRMDVVVGMRWRQTKVFESEVTGVRLNPTWTVPLRLKMEDFLPKLRKDANYLADKQIELIKGYGRNAEKLDPKTINWKKVGWREMGEMRMVQVPGDHNALGRVRILMPNKYNIYLHDTNHKELFARQSRTLSSGCVRLSDPEKIAHFVLKGTEGWSEAKMREILDTGEKTDLDAARKFPTYIRYYTMWLDENGKLIYGADVYRRDARLVKALTELDGYRLPRPAETRTLSL
jgi:murein L,D-transpeptidase YcbB/YkuD